MNQFYRFSIVMVFLFIFSGFAIGQNTLSVSTLSKDNSTSTWHFFKQEGAAKIYYQYVDCGPIEFINFKVENTSNQAITVSWNFGFTLNGSAIATNPDDVNVTMTIGAGASEYGVCFGSSNLKLNIFIRESLQAYRLDAIIFNNLTVTN